MPENIALNQQQIQSRTVGESYFRGETLYDERAIFLPVRRVNALSAMCVGSAASAYRVTARLDHSGILETDCTCPYDWGGDCKHIVAMLLTYLQQPERFRIGKSLRDELMSLKKDDLVDIVEQMIERFTGLDDIVERMLDEAA